MIGQCVGHDSPRRNGRPRTSRALVMSDRPLGRRCHARQAAPFAFSPNDRSVLGPLADAHVTTAIILAWTQTSAKELRAFEEAGHWRNRNAGRLHGGAGGRRASGDRAVAVAITTRLPARGTHRPPWRLTGLGRSTRNGPRFGSRRKKTGRAGPLRRSWRGCPTGPGRPRWSTMRAGRGPEFPAGDLYRIRGSAAACLAFAEALPPASAHVRRHLVVLGFQLTLQGRRWLKTHEIAAKVLNTVRSGKRLTVVGTVSPWERRPPY